MIRAVRIIQPLFPRKDLQSHFKIHLHCLSTDMGHFKASIASSAKFRKITQTGFSKTSLKTLEIVRILRFKLFHFLESRTQTLHWMKMPSNTWILTVLLNKFVMDTPKNGKVHKKILNWGPKVRSVKIRTLQIAFQQIDIKIEILSQFLNRSRKFPRCKISLARQISIQS